MKRTVANKTTLSSSTSIALEEVKTRAKPPSNQFRRRRKPRKITTGYRSTSLFLALLLAVLVAIGVLVRRPSFHSYGNNESSSDSGIKDKSLNEFSNNQQKAPSEVHEAFPVSFEGDVEEVAHPATSYGATLPEGIPGTLILPKFWNPPNYGGDVRRYLGGGELPTREKATSIGSFHQGEETVLVGIASYRDPECRNTVNDLYLRAEHPSRIRTVVVDQLREGDIKCTQPELPCDEDPEQMLCKFGHLIHSFELDARLAVGPTFARHLAHRHYRGEYFVLQIDAHVRFVQNWDSDIIEQWKSASNEMAVLSTYMLDLNGSIDQVTHKSRKTSRALMCNVFFEGGILRNGLQGARPPGIHGQPTIHPYWAAGFSFARGHFVIQVPYDPYLPQVFQGEEMSIGLRGFTFGYDYYAPERNVCFHMYAINKYKENRLSVPHFSENKKIFKGVADDAMMRLISVLGMNNDKTVPYNQLEEDKYGVGKARKVQTFFTTFGIDPEKQTTENHLCWFVGENMQRCFLPALRRDGMGIDYDQLTYVFTDPAPDQP